MKRNKGFTLAEVLVTLAIIGVVAALTIPTLIQSSANSKIVAGVRKAQSVLSGAILRYAVDNGCEGDLRTCGLFNVDDITAWNALKPYFAVAKNCGMATGEGCFAKGVTYRLLEGSNLIAIDDTADYAKSVLADGTSLYIYDYGGNCNLDFSKSNTGPLLNTCGYFVVDINGQKGPNQYGRDSFGFYITKQGVYPLGTFDDVTYSTAGGDPECDPAVDQGLGCTAKVLMEGAVNY